MKESTFKKYCLVVDEWFVNGFNGTQAYLKFYPNAGLNTADKGFRDIHEIPRVKEYIESKQNKTSNKLQITLERQVRELEELKALAKGSEKFNDAINALKEQSKLLGLYEEDNKQKQTDLSNSKVTINFKNKRK